jgi:1,4-dihydroxy-2-naphthoyl-CoA hydrolase
VTGTVESAFLRIVGLQLDEVSATRVTGWIELGPDHHQSSGIVHGGVFATAVERAAGVGATAAAQAHGSRAVGVNNNTNFLRPVSSGRVTVEAVPLHQGATQQLWEVRITDRDTRLVAVGHVRLQNVKSGP